MAQHREDDSYPAKHRKPEHVHLVGETDPYRVRKLITEAEAENARQMERIAREAYEPHESA